MIGLFHVNRYWGCPIPVWKSDDPKYPHIEVYGSIAEMEAAFGVKIESLHRPFVDTLTKPNPKDPTGKSKMVRITDIFDCWFESGSMPYAQVHYPFDNKEWFENNFPADFIVEYIGQTRGWFYTLMVLSTALFDRPPFLNCICHGVILGDGAQKMSKRLKNYPNPNDMFKEVGADAMRWNMISSPVMKGQEMIIDKEGKVFRDVVRFAIKPFWNAYNFFIMYANADGIKADLDLSSSNIMDRYIISRSVQMTKKVMKFMDGYDTVSATKEIESFFEVLNNWYIRRSRDRFWKREKDLDKKQAYNTLYAVLITTCKTIAPLMPFISDEIYQGLTQGDSVHLESYPTVEYEVDYSLIDSMERIRDACNSALYLRNELGIKVRQPLAEVTMVGIGGLASSEQLASQEMRDLVLEEVNVKSWKSLDSLDLSKYADYRVKINFATVGKRFPSRVKDIISANKAGDWSLRSSEAGENTILEIAGEKLINDEFSVTLAPKEEYKNTVAPLSSNDAIVILDSEITKELYQEGIARDLVRYIQQNRKDRDFNITDRINIILSVKQGSVHEAISLWEDYVKEQTLADKFSFTEDALNASERTEVEIEGNVVAFVLENRKEI